MQRLHPADYINNYNKYQEIKAWTAMLGKRKSEGACGGGATVQQWCYNSGAVCSVVGEAAPTNGDATARPVNAIVVNSRLVRSSYACSASLAM